MNVTAGCERGGCDLWSSGLVWVVVALVSTFRFLFILPGKSANTNSPTRVYWGTQHVRFGPNLHTRTTKDSLVQYRATGAVLRQGTNLRGKNDKELQF
jgi:hypothetical protein